MKIKMDNPIEPDEYFFESDEEFGDDTCPNCCEPYDEIDYEYQICHFCGFNNNEEKS